jgi:hypothetical protein
MYVFGGVLAVMVIRNMIFTDYTKETRAFLGKDADIIVPPSKAELVDRRKQLSSTYESLIKNVTLLMAERREIRKQLSDMQIELEDVKKHHAP